MLFVLVRFIFRFTILSILVGYIIYFNVLGYKYSKNTDIFFKSSGTYEFFILSKKDYFFLNGKKLYLVNHKFIIDNLPQSSCIELSLAGKRFFKCLENKNFDSLFYIDPKLAKILPFNKKFFFKISKKITNINQKYEFQIYLKGHLIKFVYLKNGDLIYDSGLLGFITIKHIVGAEFIGYTSNGLVFAKNNKLYLLKLTY